MIPRCHHPRVFLQYLRTGGNCRAAVCPSQIYKRSQGTDQSCTTSGQVRPFDEIPGPRGLPIVGSVLHYIRDGGFSKIYRVHQKFFKQYGPIFKETLMGNNAVNICNPEDIEKVVRAEGKYPIRPFSFDGWERARRERGRPLPFISKNGEEWSAERKVLARKLMRPKELNQNVSNLNCIADDAMTSMRKVRSGEDKPEGEIQDLEHEVTKYTTECIGSLVFDTRIGLFADPPRKEALEFIDATKTFFPCLLNLIVGYEAILCKYVDTPSLKQLRKSEDKMLELGYTFLNEKMRATKGDQSEPQGFSLLAYLLSGTMTAEEVNMHALDLFAGGVDTTATTLTWFLYNLARNPRAQERLYQEIVAIVGPCGSLSARDLGRIPYLRGCLKESMRLKPPGVFNLRRLDDDVTLHGYHVPAGTVVHMAMYNCSFNDELLTNSSDVFRPERWLRDGGDDIHPFAIAPFGIGKRMCLGKRVAEMEIFLYVAKLIQQFKLEYNHEQVEMVTKLLLSPEKPILINFIDRTC